MDLEGLISEKRESKITKIGNFINGELMDTENK